MIATFRPQVRALTLLLSLFCCLALNCGTAVAETRLALVIGNSKYQGTAALDNPVNDAADLSRTLRSTGFDVIEVHDATREAMVSAMRVFAERVPTADVALFYYAGHGLQMKGENYLVPVDAKIENETDVRFNTISLSDIQQEMGSARTANVIILDACRNNPFAEALGHGTRGAAARGLEPIQAAGVGSLVVFSTQPDNVSLDGRDRNSPFASALLKHIATPGLEIRQMISRVRSDVLQATDHKQVPWDNSSLIGDVYLASAPAPVAQPETPVPVATVTPASEPRVPVAPPIPVATEASGPAADCQRLAPLVPPFATPAQIKAASTVDWTRVLPICQAAVDAQPTDMKLQRLLGRAFEHSKNYLEAAHHYTIAADAGYAPAENDLGVLETYGRGMVINHQRAFELFAKAANSGWPPAMNSLGAAYSNGWGVKEDDARALSLFEKAIEAGSADGLAEAGIMYFGGKGTERDYEAAAQYFQQAADIGNGYSMKFLALMYEHGLLGKPDPAKAAELRLQAAEVDPNSIDPIVNFPKQVPHAVHAARRRVVFIRRYRFFGCLWAWC